MLIIGTGQTAAHIATEFINRGSKITIISEHDGFVYRCVDSTPHFFRPEGRSEYQKDCKSEKFIFPSSVMWEFKNKIDAAISRGQIDLIPKSTLRLENNTLSLTNRKDFDFELFDVIIPCFGIKPKIPDFINPNYVLDQSCQVGDNLYIIGTLAKQVVGPSARNIEGHRIAIERVRDSIVRKHYDR